MPRTRRSSSPSSILGDSSTTSRSSEASDQSQILSGPPAAQYFLLQTFHPLSSLLFLKDLEELLDPFLLLRQLSLKLLHLALRITNNKSKKNKAQDSETVAHYCKNLAESRLL